MNRGLLQVLFCALLLTLTSSPAWGICRPENRVGGSPVFSSDFASQESAKPIGTPSENPGYGYDFASGVHKYLYCQGNPVMNTDPSGKAVWLVTRPLSMFGLNLLAPIAVHVFLAFDDNLVGTSADLAKWAPEVQNDNQNVGNINSAVLSKWGSYQSDPHLTTFSFHPYSVAAGNGEKNQGGVFGTSGSCVAYNAPEDRGAFYQAGGNAWGYKRYWITGDINEQIKIYKRAIESRDINNAGTPNEHPYSGFDYNCGSWTKFIIKQGGGSFPSNFINLGTGLGGPADYTGVPTLVTTAARGWNPHYDSGNNMSTLFQWNF